MNDSLRPWLFSFAVLVFLTGQASAAPIEFNRDIRPILSDNCFQCHGPDKARRKAGLRLDTEEGAAKVLGALIRPRAS